MQCILNDQKIIVNQTPFLIQAQKKTNNKMSDERTDIVLVISCFFTLLNT